MPDQIINFVADVLGLLPELVDSKSSFIQSGGDSLTALRLAAYCKEAGILLSVPAILRAPSIRELSEWTDTRSACRQIEDIQGHRAELLPLTAKKPQVEVVKGSLGTLQNGVHDSSMTELQLALIHGSLKDTSANIIHYYETYNTQDLPKIKQAWRTVINQEPSLRLRFDGSTQLASASSNKDGDIDWVEATFDGELEARSALDPSNSTHLAWSSTSLDTWDMSLNTIELAPSFRIAIYPDRRVPGNKVSTMKWSIHHALIDGFSAMLVLDRVQRVAAGEVLSPGRPFSELTAALKDYQKANRTAGDSFWDSQKEISKNAMCDLLLPQPAVNPSGLSSAYVSVGVRASVDDLKQSAVKAGVTSAAIYYAAWAIVLSIYGDADTVCLGAVLAGRDLPLPYVAETVGPLVNTLPVYVEVTRGQGTVQLLQAVFEKLITLSRFQWTTPENGFTRSFRSTLAIQYEYTATFCPSHSTQWPATRQGSDIPISVVINPNGMIEIVYHTTEFHHKSIECLAECYKSVLQVLCRPGTTIDHCLQAATSVLDLEMLRGYGNCDSGLTTKTSVTDDLVTLLESTSSKQPKAVAMEYRTTQMTYEELNAAASRIAFILAPLIKPEEVVCVNADGSMQWIIALYGVLKAGGAICSLDSASPPEVREDMFLSSGAGVFIVGNEKQHDLCPKNSTACVTVDNVLQTVAQKKYIEVREHAMPWRAAYLCLTSGSSGKPKGVLCTHEGLVAFQRDLEVRLFAKPGQRVAQAMSVAFDGSIHEIFSALSYGATLVLKDPCDPFAHLNKVDAAILTPTLASTLYPDDFPNIRAVYLVGEPVPQRVVDTWGGSKSLYNMYGPTEGTCGATIKRLLPQQPVTIGHPNPSTRIYILNRYKELLPPGVIGEIYLAGVQVARGYVGMPDATRERFISDTICRGLGEFMYKTGDHGFWNEGGEIVCVGRRDRQIKLRGFRLDLNDLEVRMLRADNKVAAVAVAQCHDYLIAAVKPVDVDVTAFRHSLTRLLPAHALPRHIAAMADFPKTKIGKLDYKAIAATATELGNRQSKLCGSTEQRVAAVWGSTLRLEPGTLIHADDSFVNLGGHSLLQLQLTFKLSREFGVRVLLSDVIDSGTLTRLAQRIDTLRENDRGIPSCGRQMQACDLSPIEREWWKKYRLDASSSAFNVSLVCSLDPSIVDLEQLCTAWNVVMARHPILRSQYVADVCCDDRVRRIFAARPPQVQRLRSLNGWQEINRPFKLDRSPLIRVFMTQEYLIVVVSHIICDLTTMQVLLAEVSDVYENNKLGPVKQTYAQSSLWNMPPPPCHLSFWSKFLDGVPEVPRYFLDPPPRRNYRGTSFAALLPESLWLSMQDYCQHERVTMQQLASAAVGLALAPEGTHGRTDVMLGIPYINRRSDDDLQTIGLFLEPLPVRIQYPPEALNNATAAMNCVLPANETYVQMVQRSTQAAFGHAIGLTELLTHLGISPRYPSHPLFDAVVTFHDLSNRALLSLPLPGANVQNYWSEGSKFKIMVEFHAISDVCLSMRIEYDNLCFQSANIDLVQQRIIRVMELIVANKPHDDIKREITSMSSLSTKDSLRSALADFSHHAHQNERGVLPLPLVSYAC